MRVLGVVGVSIAKDLSVDQKREAQKKMKATAERLRQNDKKKLDAGETG